MSISPAIWFLGLAQVFPVLQRNRFYTINVYIHIACSIRIPELLSIKHVTHCNLTRLSCSYTLNVISAELVHRPAVALAKSLKRWKIKLFKRIVIVVHVISRVHRHTSVHRPSRLFTAPQRQPRVSTSVCLREILTQLGMRGSDVQ